MSPNYPGQYLDESEPSVTTAQVKQTQVRKSLKISGVLAALAAVVYAIWNLWRK